MDWLKKDDVLRAEDLSEKSLDYKLLEYKPLPCMTIDMAGNEEQKVVQAHSHHISTDSEWLGWLKEKKKLDADNELGAPQDGLRIVFAQGAPRKCYSTMTLTKLPFSKSCFVKICDHLSIHRSILRVLARSTVAAFHSQMLAGANGQPKIVYNCRTSGVWDNDLALAATHFPDRHFTYAIIFGCTFETQMEIHDRLQHLDCRTIHPFIIPTIFAELERERHVTFFRAAREQLGPLMASIWTNRPVDNLQDDAASTMIIQKSNYLLSEWARLRNGLENWRDQLVKMVQHVDTLSQTCFAPSSTPEVATSDEAESRRAGMQAAGQRIKDRLLELKSEYDSHIRECYALADNMTQGMQIQWNMLARQDSQTSLKMAATAKEHTLHMRSIAILTMFFLPTMAVSSVFSTTFFNWSAERSEDIISPYAWVFLVLSLILTVVLVLIWRHFTKRAHSTQDTIPV